MGQQSLTMWSSLVKERTSILGIYAETHSAQDQARHFVLWSQVLLYLGISERTKTICVSPGFRVANLKSMDSMESIEIGNHTRGDPVYRDTSTFEAEVGTLVTSASVRTARLNTSMVTDTVLRHILTACPKLEALDIRGASLTDSDSMALILRTCGALSNFKFSFPYLSKRNQVRNQVSTWNHAVIDALAESPTVCFTKVAIEHFNSCVASVRDAGGSELGFGERALSKFLMRHGANLQCLSLADWPLREEVALD